MLSDRDDVFDRVILTAPLVRPWGWKQAKIGYQLYKGFGDTVPRAKRRNSSDEKFLEFNRNRDKLHLQEVSLKWVKALDEWNGRIAAAAKRDGRILVIQGSDDTTVAWKYNIKFIKTKFSDVDVRMIEKGRHELFNEAEEMRNEVFSQIGSYLEGKNG